MLRLITRGSKAEGQQLAGQHRGSFPGVVNLLHIRVHRIVLADLRQHKLRHPVDHREQVVEVVCNATGELPHTLHLMRLTKLAFELQALGNFTDVALDESLLVHLIGIADKLHLDPPPVLRL